MRISQQAVDWLTTTQTASVLHKYDTVWNLINQDKRVISLISSDIPMGAFAWQIDNTVSFSNKIHVQNGTIQIGSRLLDSKDATLWQARPIWHTMHKFQEETSGKFHGLSALLIAIASRNRTLVTYATRTLAGRGRGLTPEGDDVLMGVIYALWSKGFPRGWMRTIAETAIPMTTSLSAEMLRSAAHGNADQPWHWMLDKGDPTAIVEIGDSSGRAAWTGYTATLGILNRQAL